MHATPLRFTRMIAALAAAVLLAGCVYDPYTGTYEPCCNNPYPHYAPPAYAPPAYAPPAYAPPAYAPSPYPYAYPPPYYPPPPTATQPYGYAPQAPAGAPLESPLAQRFAQANVTHDGRLTLQQAQAADWQVVARNFPAIDIDRKGYVTLNELRAWLETHQPPPSFLPG